MAGIPPSIPPSSKSYFHGRITRDQAETVLKQSGAKEGLFLLRESLNTAGNYAISICHLGQVHHYSIERQVDGTVMIAEGKRFPGPIELIEHHKLELDGFLVRPAVPCIVPDGQSPMAWPGVPMIELDKALLAMAESKNLKGDQLALALGPQRQKFVAMVAKEMHRGQAWFYDNISRSEGEEIMKRSGHRDGKFLVRTKSTGDLAVSLSYKSMTKHYKIIMYRDGRLGIQDGPKFENIMDLVGHYYNKADGMLCKLTQPCIRPGYEAKQIVLTALERNVIYGTTLGTGTHRPSRRSSQPLPPTPSDIQARRLPQVPIDKGWDQPEAVGFSGTHDPNVDQKIYDDLPTTDDMFRLNPRDLKLEDDLGSGCFGSVKKGVFRRHNQDIPVAVKTLKQDLPTAQEELMREARIMADLKHRHIVRMIGVCRGSTVMLVLELAPLGPLNKYLKNNITMSVEKVLRILYQVALGMEYLESKNFVHRDLAARNVLLVTENFAKISDFGMSKALGLDNAYYQADTAGKWPLKWYAPECIFYWKFDSKSDVWSFGITMWEALSFGEKPYKGMKGQQIIDMLEAGERLSRPNKCPVHVFEVMKDTWRMEKKERPMFADIVKRMQRHY